MKRILPLSLLSGLSLLFSFATFGQTFNITRSTGVIYSSIASSGTSVTGWKNSNNTDDNLSTAQPIGFSFTYKGTSYTQFLVSINGFLTFSTSTTAMGNGSSAYGFNNANFTTSSALTASTLAVFYDDLICQGANASLATLNASVKYAVSGTAPNRVLTVEWINMGQFQNDAPRLNFQVKLYETTNVIEYIYGGMEGFRGINTQLLSYTLGVNGSTVSSTPTAAELQTQQVENVQNFSALPKNDLASTQQSFSMYRFTPGTYAGAAASPGAPANDNSAGAITLPVNTSQCNNLTGTYYTGLNATATPSITACNAASPGTPDDDVWFRFTPTKTTAVVAVRGSATYDPVVQSFSSTLSSRSCKNATGVGLTETDTLTGLTVGSVYFVRVYHAGVGASSVPDFSICIYDIVPPPANDDICGALALTVQKTCTPAVLSGNTLTATASPQAVCSAAPGTPDDDVWYRFVATASSHVIVVGSGSGFNAHFQVFGSSDNTCAGTLTSLNCTNAAAVSVPEINYVSGLTVGDTYYIRVYHTSLGAGSGEFTIHVQEGYIWSGAVSAATNIAGNWCPQILPLSGAPVVIASVANPPLLAGNTNYSNISIADGATLTIGNFTLTVSGAITGQGTLKGSSGSSLTFTGPGSAGALRMDQSQPGTSNLLNNLTLNKTSAGSLSLADKLIVATTFTPTAGTLTTNGHLTLRSTATGTARVAVVNAAAIDGDVTVERYIPAAAKAAWRMLAAPVTGTSASTIHAAWQEGAVSATDNPVPGYGTRITQAGGAGTGGYDGAPASSVSTLRYFNGTAWVPVANTNSTKVDDNGGTYLLLVKGDRSVDPAGAATGNTVLRMKGRLHTGNVTAGIAGTNFSLIPNPYASPLDFEAVRTGNGSTLSAYYIYDAGINNFRLVERLAATTYEHTPSSGATATENSARYIQSGQAFLVPGSMQLNFTESMKTATATTFNAFRTMADEEQLAVNLEKEINSAYTLSDGVRVKFNTGYSAQIVNGEDFAKLPGLDENLGLVKGGMVLSLEKRPLVAGTDTVQLQLWNTTTGTYRMVFQPTNLVSPTGIFLEDLHTGTVSVINSSTATTVQFSVDANVPNSVAPGRFRIVFGPFTTLSTKFVTVTATRQDKQVKVDWQTANEAEMLQYTIQRSADGVTFEMLGNVHAKNSQSASYSFTDASPLEGTTFYRVAAQSRNAQTTYSAIAKVKSTGPMPGLTVYPNPARGQALHLQLGVGKPGEYDVRIFNNAGQEVFITTIKHDGSHTAKTVTVPALGVQGIYTLRISNGNEVKQQRIIRM